MRRLALALLLLADQAGAVALGLSRHPGGVTALVPPLALDRSPELPRLAQDLRGMLATLAKSEPVRAVPELRLVDDMRPYARLSLEDGAPRMTVSLGMLSFVADDDELAYVLAQELDRPAAQLSALAATVSDDDFIRKMGLERMADSESDVKAVLGRVMDNGWSPHGAYSFMTRARERFGETASSGLGYWSQRRDTVGLAIAYWTRERGRESADRLGESARRREVVGPVKSGLLDAQANRAARARALAAVAKSPVDTADAEYASAVDPAAAAEATKRNLWHFGGAYEKDFVRNWEEMRRLGVDELPDKRVLSLQLGLHESLYAAYEKARAKHAGEDYRTEDRESLSAVLGLGLRAILLSAPEPALARKEWRERRREIRTLERRAARAEGVERETLESELAEARKRFSEVERGWKAARAVLDGKPDAVTKGVDRILRKGSPYPSIGHTPGEFAAVSGAGVHRVQEAFARVLPSRKALLERHLPMILETRHGLERFGGMNGGTTMGWFLELRPDPKDAEPLLETYVKLVEELLAGEDAALDRGGTLQGLNPVHYTSRDVGKRIWELLEQYSATDPAKAEQLARRAAAAVADWAASGREIASFLQTASAGDESVKFSAPLVAGLVAGLSPALEGFLEDDIDSQPFHAITGFETSQWMLAPEQDREPLSAERRSELLERAARAIAALLKAEPTEERLAALRGFLKIRHPWLFLAPSERKSRAAMDRLYEPLLALSRDALLSKKLIGAVSYQYLVDLLHDPAHPRRFEELIMALGNIVKLEYRSPLDRDPFDDGFDEEDETKPRPPDKNQRMHLRLAARAASDAAMPLKRAIEYLSLLRGEAGRLGGTRILRAAYDRAAASKRPDETVEAAGHRGFWTAWEKTGNPPFNSSALSAFVESLIPDETLPRLEYFVRAVKGVAEYMEDLRARGGPQYYGSVSEGDNRLGIGALKAAARDEAALKASDSSLLAAVVQSVALGEAKSDPLYDRYFEELSSRPDGPAAMRELIKSPRAVAHLHFDENKLALAKEQLAAAVDLDAAAAAGKEAGHDVVRPAVVAALELVEKQFPGHSPAHERMLSWLESRLMTTRAETKLVSAVRLNSDNWKDVRGIEALDQPQIMNRRLKTQTERELMLEYLTEDGREPPAIPSLDNTFGREWTLNELTKAKRFFTDFNLPLRVYILQPMLDENKGLLSDPIRERRLIDRVLGERLDEPVVRAALEAYLRNLPIGEKKAVLGYLLASRLGRKQGGASLKAVLEAMGPLGVKAGQFLRTSGVLPAAERAQLDDFLDKALPPTRAEVFELLTAGFGPDLQGIVWVGRVLGSGSLNVLVEVGMLDPETGKVRRVAVRLLREAAKGQAANENLVWEKAAKELMASEDSAIRRAGRLADEARAQAWFTLGPDGAEMDLSIERGAEAEAREAYESAESDGLSVSVSIPLHGLQKRWVLPDEEGRPRSKTVSVYEIVDHVPHAELTPEERASAARRIIRAELDAMLKKGVFDADGHRGNWLFDRALRRLVRVDYAQIRRIGPARRKALAETLAALIRPSADRAMRRALTRRLPELFELDGGVPLPSTAAADLAEVLADPALPDFRAPQERLLFLQERLESKWRETNPDAAVRLAPELRSAVASLAKLSLYRETVGDRAYFEALLDATGFGRWRFALLLAWERFVAKR